MRMEEADVSIPNEIVRFAQYLAKDRPSVETWLATSISSLYNVAPTICKVCYEPTVFENCHQRCLARYQKSQFRVQPSPSPVQTYDTQQAKEGSQVVSSKERDAVQPTQILTGHDFLSEHRSNVQTKAAKVARRQQESDEEDIWMDNTPRLSLPNRNPERSKQAEATGSKPASQKAAVTPTSASPSVAVAREIRSSPLQRSGARTALPAQSRQASPPKPQQPQVMGSGVISKAVWSPEFIVNVSTANQLIAFLKQVTGARMKISLLDNGSLGGLIVSYWNKQQDKESLALATMITHLHAGYLSRQLGLAFQQEYDRLDMARPVSKIFIIMLKETIASLQTLRGSEMDDCLESLGAFVGDGKSSSLDQAIQKLEVAAKESESIGLQSLIKEYLGFMARPSYKALFGLLNMDVSLSYKERKFYYLVTK